MPIFMRGWPLTRRRGGAEEDAEKTLRKGRWKLCGLHVGIEGSNAEGAETLLGWRHRGRVGLGWGGLRRGRRRRVGEFRGWPLTQRRGGAEEDAEKTLRKGRWKLCGLHVGIEGSNAEGAETLLGWRHRGRVELRQGGLRRGRRRRVGVFRGWPLTRSRGGAEQDAEKTLRKGRWKLC